MTLDLPSTRHSLLIQLRNHENSLAWDEFLQTYRPAIYRLARRRGLQPAAASDLCQQIMLAMLRKVSQWETGSERGSFRAWLLTVAKNAVHNALTRKRNDLAIGGLSPTEFDDQCDQADPTREEIDWEFRRASLRRLLVTVEPDVHPTTWQCFIRTSVENVPASEVAQQLRLSVAAVYTNKSRVLKRLRERAAELQAQFDLDGRE